MTTLIIDTKRRVVASDSLMTIEYSSNEGSIFNKEVVIKREFEGGMQKLFKLKGGVVFACCGNRGLSNKVLFDFMIPHTTSDADNFSKGDNARVLVTNPYTNTVAIYTVTAKSSKKVVMTRTWLSRCTNVRGGSGEEIAGKCFRKGIAIEDCIRYASYGDKHSGGELQLMGY